MGRIWGWLVGGAVLGLAALWTVNARPQVSPGSEGRAFLTPTHDFIARANDRISEADASPADDLERAGLSNRLSPKAIALFFAAAELALAVIVALTCGIVLTIAGIYVSLEERAVPVKWQVLPRAAILQPATNFLGPSASRKPSSV